MRKLLFLLVLAIANATGIYAQSEGINFHHELTWAQATAKAKAENKLIFIDFYTQWCGPCMNMAQNVFTLPSVGAFYNSTFVNLKIDAERGEGVTLAKKFGVRSYPTYAFIDPATEQMVHRSGSRQTPEQFIRTGKDALVPTRRSFYLQEQYSKGNRDRAFLIDYINYNNSVYAHNNVKTAFGELINGGAKLNDNDIWPVFVNCITGFTPYLQQVSDKYTEFCQKFGKEAVDAKLAKETGYGDVDKIKALCDFNGKYFNLKMININNLLREKKYDAAANAIDTMIADPAVDQQKLIDRLKFIARLSYYRGTDIPETWFNKCVGYLQYIAYNQKDRDDAFIHQEYAAALEAVLRKLNGKATLPACITTTPKYGKKVYDMRPDALKPKPMKR